MKVWLHLCPACQAAMQAGIPKEVPSTNVNMLCESGKILDGTDTVNLQFFILSMVIVLVAMVVIGGNFNILVPYLTKALNWQ